MQHWEVWPLTHVDVVDGVTFGGGGKMMEGEPSAAKLFTEVEKLI